MDKKRILRRGIAMLLSVILLLGGCPVLSLAEAPTEETEAVPPTEETEAEAPTEETEAVIPTEETEGVPPTEETEAEAPTEEAEAVIPTGETEAVAFAEEAQEPTPAEEPEDGEEADFSGTNLMNLERVQPSGYSTTTNPYGYDVGMPFLMVEQNELMYLNVWGNQVRQASYFNMGESSSLPTFARSKGGANGSFYASTYGLMEAVSFDPTGSGRRDHVAFVGVSNKRGYLWVIDTTKSAGSEAVRF